MIRFSVVSGFLLFAAIIGGHAYSNDLLLEGKKVSIEGNERTKASYINGLISNCILEDNNYKRGDYSALEQCLLNSKLFSVVKISEREREIKVGVEDKWTTIPLPMAKSDGDETSYGLFVLDSNLFGIGAFGMVGFTESTSRKSRLLVYSDKSLFNSNWMAQGSYSLKSTIKKLRKRDKVLDAIDEKTSSSALSVGYRFSNHFNLSVGVAKHIYRYEEYEIYNKPEDNESIRGNIDIKLDYSDYRLYFQSGCQLKVSLFKDLDREDKLKDVSGGVAAFSWNKPLRYEDVIKVNMNLMYIEGGGKKDAFSLGGRGILQGSIWAERLFSVSLDYQYPLYKSGNGAFVVGAFHDQGFATNRSSYYRNVSYYSSGIGFYYFLKRVAVPGLGIEFGYNEKFEKFFSSFSLGMSV